MKDNFTTSRHKTLRAKRYFYKIAKLIWWAVICLEIKKYSMIQRQLIVKWSCRHEVNFTDLEIH